MTSLKQEIYLLLKTWCDGLIKYQITEISDSNLKGGNLALNITPQPDGELPSKTLETLNDSGKNVCYTQKEDKLIVDTKNFPLYNMKYADCLKIIF